MSIDELRTMADQLRSAGFDARNLGPEGIMIWRDGKGFFVPAAQLDKAGPAISPRSLDTLLARQSGNVCQLG